VALFGRFVKRWIGGSFAILALCGWFVRIANVPLKALVYVSV
jgi:hypothetical protein